MGEHRQKVLISTPISNLRFSVVTTIYLPDILQNYTEVYSLSKCCVEICTISLKYRRILANMVCGKNMAQLQALMVNGGSNPVEICRSSGARRRYQTICAPVSDFRPRTRPDDWNNFLLISLFVPYFPLDFGSNSSFTKCPHSFCLTIINLEKNLWQSIKDIQTKNLSCS